MPYTITIYLKSDNDIYLKKWQHLLRQQAEIRVIKYVFTDKATKTVKKCHVKLV